MNLFIPFAIAVLRHTTVAQYVWDASQIVKAAANDEFFQVFPQSLSPCSSLHTDRLT
jgi:hypothetical protein